MNIAIALLSHSVNVDDKATQHANEITHLHVKKLENTNAVIISLPGVSDCLISCTDAERLASLILEYCKKNKAKKEKK